MAFGIVRKRDGFHWFIAQSSYGASGGVAKTVRLAMVEMAIAEANIMEHPYPKFVVQQMRKNPSKTTKGWRVPKVKDERKRAAAIRGRAEEPHEG